MRLSLLLFLCLVDGERSRFLMRLVKLSPGMMFAAQRASREPAAPVNDPSDSKPSTGTLQSPTKSDSGDSRQQPGRARSKPPACRSCRYGFPTVKTLPKKCLLYFNMCRLTQQSCCYSMIITAGSHLKKISVFRLLLNLVTASLMGYCFYRLTGRATGACATKLFPSRTP